MLGHFVNALDPEAEDRVLTSKLGYAPHWVARAQCCLVGAACDIGNQSWTDNMKARELWRRQSYSSNTGVFWSVGARYDNLVQRFGERLNIAIRNRILANRARRLLTHAEPAKREEVTV